MNTSQALDMGTKLICDKLSERSSNSKRARVYESNKLYVPPQQLSLGVRWDMVKEKKMEQFQHPHSSSANINMFQ